MKDETAHPVGGVVTAGARLQYLQDDFSLIHDRLEENNLYNYPKGEGKVTTTRAYSF
jgi:hypothetical protein